MGDFINEEISIFLEAAYYGMLLGVSYDVLRIFRRVIRHKNLIVYIEDYFFWVVWGVILFALIFNYNDGELRGYVFAAVVIGAVLYLKSFSPLLVKYVSLILENILTIILKKPLKAVKMVITKIVKHIVKGIRGLNGITHRKKKEK